MTSSNYRLLIEINRTGSVSKAAEACFLSQPAASARLRTLEEQFSTKIVEKTPKGVQFTASGLILLRTARVVVAEESRLLERLGKVPGGKNWIFLGASSVPGTSQVPRLLAEYRRSNPGVYIRLRVGKTASIVRALERKKFDFAIVGSPEYSAAVEYTQLWTDEIRLCSDPALGLGDDVDPDALFRLPVLMDERGSGVGASVRSWLLDQGIDPERLDVAGDFGIPEAVLRTLPGSGAVAFLPSDIIENDVANGSIREHGISGLPPLIRPILLAKNRLVPARPCVKEFLEYLKNRCEPPNS